MDLSIIIPCYNLEDYIENCIESILSQDIRRNSCEIIFICDSCTDTTVEKIKSAMSFAPKDWTWTIEIVNYRSPGLTRNKGLDLAVGKYVWFVDGDDWLINNNAIKELMAKLWKDPTLDGVRFHFQSQGYENLGMHLSVWQYIFKRNFIGDLRFIEKTPREDDEFIKQIMKKKHNILRLHGYFYHYNHPREGSIMASELALRPSIKNKQPRQRHR